MFDIIYNFGVWNKQLFYLINHNTNIGIFPYLLQYISLPFFIANFAFYYLVACAYFYLHLKKIQNDFLRQQKFWIIYDQLVSIGIIYALFGFIYAALKFSVNLPRPFCSLPLDSFTTIANIAYERCLSSFPSAHTGLALLMTYFCWQYLNRFWQVIAVIINLLVGLSRISLAMHYPADVIYSLIIAIIVIFLGNIVHKLLKTIIFKKIGEYLYNLIKGK